MAFVSCPLRPTFHGGGVALDPISLSRIHEDLYLERQKQMPHSSECTRHLFHAFRGRPVHGSGTALDLLLAGGRASADEEARRWALT